MALEGEGGRAARHRTRLPFGEKEREGDRRKRDGGRRDEDHVRPNERVAPLGRELVAAIAAERSTSCAGEFVLLVARVGPRQTGGTEAKGRDARAEDDPCGRQAGLARRRRRRDGDGDRL